MSNLDFEPGSTVSHFRLEKKLGEGGMGAVYLAEDLTLSRRVAIKFMSRSLLAKQAKPEVREALEARFIREAKSAGAINHPNLCQIYEANFESDDWYIAMEFINGKDLVDFRAEHKNFTPTQVVDVCRQTASGLKYAWDHYKIIHRDIKPRNIMLTQENMVKIVDLGLAKPIAGPDEESTMPDVTCAGTAIGTPQYMAPEQATGESNIDYMVDIYALGATLYEMCTGEKAFNERTPTMIYMAQMSKKYKPVREFRTDMPDELIDLIDDMLEPQRGDRIESYDKILERIRHITSGGATTTLGVPTGTLEVTQVAEPVFKDYPVDHLILDRYRVMKHLGRSRAGVVYKCIDTEMGMECAVKSLAPGREFSAEDMPIIRDNYQRLMGHTDPNLVQIRDIRHEDSGELFVVMEKLDGINLREYTHRQYTSAGKLNMAAVMPVFRRVAKAIDRLNDKLEMPHNDIKPESIFVLNDSSDIKLLDYSVTARPLSNNTVLGNIDDDATMVAPEYKVPLESTDYMAPEKWEHGLVTHQADQYAFALVIYEMLARRLPFWTNDPDNAPDTSTRSPTKLERARFEKMKNQVLTETVQPVADFNKNVNAVLLTALSKHPEERFPNCHIFINRLARAAGVREKSVMVPVLIGVALVVFAVLGGLAWWRSSQRTHCVAKANEYKKEYALLASSANVSKTKLNEVLRSAVEQQKTAEQLQTNGKFSDAEQAYVEAISALKTAEQTIKTFEEDEAETASRIRKDVEERLKRLENRPLAVDLMRKIQALQQEALRIQKIDSRRSAWESCQQELTRAEQAFAAVITRYEKEMSVLRDRVSEDLRLLEAEPLILELAEARKIRDAVIAKRDQAVALLDRESKADMRDWPLIMKRWNELKTTIPQARDKLQKMREQLAKTASESKMSYMRQLGDLQKQYGDLAPELFRPAKQEADVARQEKNHDAIEKWKSAQKLLQTASVGLAELATEYRGKVAKVSKACLAEQKRIASHALGADLLTKIEPLINNAKTLTADHQLKKSLSSWETIQQVLTETAQVLAKRVKDEAARQAQLRLERRKSILRIRNTYPQRFATVRTHELSEGLLKQVPDPKAIFNDVPQNADDHETLSKLLQAEATLKLAEAELGKRVKLREAELKTKVAGMLTTYETRLKKMLENPLAEEMVAKAEEHAKIARMALQKKEYNAATISLVEADRELKTAELQLAELMANEAERLAAMQRRVKAKIAGFEKKYTSIRTEIAEDQLGQDLLEEADQKANQARAVSNTGNDEGALKVWQEAILAITDAKAELDVRREADRQKLEALKKRNLREAKRLSESYADKRAFLAKSPFSKGKFTKADAAGSDAKVAGEKGDHVAALANWKKAMSLLEDVENDLEADIKTQAEKLRKEVLAMRKKVKEWEDWDATIGEKLVAYDVTFAMAREREERQEFVEAGKQLVRCKEILIDVQKFVKGKFLATPGKDFTLGKINMEFVWIKSMRMWVGKYEVTNRQYRMFKPKHSSKKHNGMTLNGDEQPVVQVSYFDAFAYATWLTNGAQILGVLPKGYKFRLPTVKEWIRYASSGKVNNKYPWGEKWPPPHGNYANQEVFPETWKLKGYTDEFPVTCPVKKSGKNKWGLYGTSGNVWEWSSQKRNSSRGVLGGAWESTDPRLMQLDLKGQNFTDPQVRYDNVGFRILLVPAKQ